MFFEYMVLLSGIWNWGTFLILYFKTLTVKYLILPNYLIAVSFGWIAIKIQDDAKTKHIRTLRGI